MALNKITDLSETAADNIDIAGVGVQGTDAISNIDNAIRAFGSMVAKVDRGTDPVRDTWTFGDPADLTKRVRLDAGNVTAGQTRVLSMPDANVTLPSGTLVTETGTQTLTNKTLTSPTLTTPTLTLKQGASEAPTDEGDIRWDSDDNRLVIGDGAATKTFSPNPASTAEGDIEYYTAANVKARLAKGTAGQILTMNAGATAPEWQDAPTTYGAIGTYVFGMIRNNGVTENSTYAGSDIEPGGLNSQAGALADDTAGTGVGIHKGGSALSGTWQAMGRSNLSGSPLTRWTLFLRIS